MLLCVHTRKLHQSICSDVDRSYPRSFFRSRAEKRVPRVFPQLRKKLRGRKCTKTCVNKHVIMCSYKKLHQSTCSHVDRSYPRSFFRSHGKTRGEMCPARFSTAAKKASLELPRAFFHGCEKSCEERPGYEANYSTHLEGSYTYTCNNQILTSTSLASQTHARRAECARESGHIYLAGPCGRDMGKLKQLIIKVCACTPYLRA